MGSHPERVDGCAVCNSLKALTPERTLWESDEWIAGSMLDVPGWIILATKRHAEGAWSLDDAEAAAFGTVAREIAQTLKDVTSAERIHQAAMGEVALHYHIGFLPRRAGQTPVFDSTELVRRASDEQDLAATLNVERLFKETLAAGRGTMAN